MNVNESQKIAIEHKDGPMLVLAGPGSGKTFVITNRTKYLIEEHGIHPSNILVITFTKAAAEEMKERFLKIMEETDTLVSFGTFHAVFFKILKYAYNFGAQSIIREEDRYQYFREIIADLDLEIEDEKEFIEGITSEISLVKGERIAVENYYSINCSEENFQKIYKQYEYRLRKTNLIDFDDMLLLCYELLSERLDILANWQKKYCYILIDEFQDINRVQYDIIRLLAKPENNLFIVGDDDQSIYRFRGAKPEIMLNFENDYITAKRVLLNKNYRSTQNIVKGGIRVVSNNTKRFVKEIEAVKEAGQHIDIKVFSDIMAQNEAVLEGIKKFNKQEISYKDIAVLFRTNTQPRSLLEKLMEYNIPFRMRDMMQNLYEHWICKDMIAYVEIALGNRERSLFLRIINHPKRYIVRDCMKDSVVDFVKLKSFFKDKPYVVERIEKLEFDLNMIRKLNPFAAINYIRRVIGYDEYLIDYAKFRRMKEDELFEVLAELQEGARVFNDYNSWFLHMKTYKEELKQQSDLSKKNIDGVAMATFHASKGLEYRKVFIIDVNEGITPHRKACILEDLEEERRMFYVAMTRAKEELFLYSVKERYGKKLKVSRFIGELLNNEAAFVVDARVIHVKYGVGTIIQKKDQNISIKFDKEVFIKTFNYEFCVQNQLLRIVEYE